MADGAPFPDQSDPHALLRREQGRAAGPAGRADPRLSGFSTGGKGHPLARTVFDPGAETRLVTYDVDADRTVVRNSRNDGSARIDDIGTTIAYSKVKEFSIARNDPATAESIVAVSVHYTRADWDAKLADADPYDLRSESTLSFAPTSMPMRAARAASAAASSIA